MDKEELYADYRKKMDIIEDQRIELTKKLKDIDAAQDTADDIRNEMNRLFRNIWRHCDEDAFIHEAEFCENEFDDAQRLVENDLEEQRGIMETEQRNNYRREDELLEDLHRAALLSDRE